MATYIQGVTDYIPQIQEFKPNFNFYNKSLQMRQSKYDANHERLSNLYGSLMNSPMLREQNIEARDQFFKVIDQDIQKMASLDLSKQQNVQAASSVFNQLLDNKDMVKDMVWTKNWQKEHQRADAFRNCIDSEKCGGAWWQEGVTALNYQAEEFKTASEEEARNFGSSKFTPYQDVMGKAVKLAKEADLNISIDKRTGGYIVTTKNGPNIIRPLQSLFMGQMGKDPAITDYYKTKAYVARKNWVGSNVAVYGSEEAAEAQYMQQAMQQMAPKLAKAEDDVKFTKNNIETERQLIEKQVKQEGTRTGSALLDVYNEMTSIDEAMSSTTEVMTEANGNLKVAASNKISKSSLANLDAALAMGYLQTDIGAAAQTLAYKDYEVSMKADPYALENVRHSNRLSLEDRRYGNRKALLNYKFELDQYDKKLDARGGALANNPLMRDVTTGGYNISEDPEGAFKNYKKNRDDLISNISAPEKAILVEAMKLTQERSKSSGGIANEDLVSMLDAVVNEMGDIENYRDISGNSSAVGAVVAQDPVLRKYKAMNKAQKLKFAQNYDFNKLEKLNGTTIDNIYNDKLLPILDMKNPTNSVSRKYLSNLWNTSSKQRDVIKSKNANLDGLDSWYAKETANIKAAMRAQSEYDPYIEMIDSYVDKNGNIRTEKEFIESYTQHALANNPTPEHAEQVYAHAVSDATEAYRDNEEGIRHVWKKAFSENVNPKGIPGYLKGIDGSVAIEKAIGFPTVDPSQYMSVGTMGVAGFLKDVSQANSEQAKVRIASMSGEIPPESSESAQAILNQIQKDLATRTDPKDKKRPILDISYQDVAGGNEGWTAMNIKVNDGYLSQYVGSKGNQGVIYDNRTNLQTTGLTVYLKKDAATNMFYKNAQKTDIDNVMDWTGQFDFDEYPDVNRDLKIIRKENGGYSATGSFWNGIDVETGEDMWEPFAVDQNNPSADVNEMVGQIRAHLKERELEYQYLTKLYNQKYGLNNIPQ